MYFSKNTSIPIEFYEKHLDKIDWSSISQNNSIPLEFFEKHLDKVYLSELSKNTSIIMKQERIRKINYEFMNL
jgi:hypothetical protein